jgi:large subunit ribosomal protein L9
MKVILKETINSLGIIGSEVEVADGYARNYLLPQNKAVLASAKNRKILEQEKSKFEVQIAKEKNIAEEMAEMLQGVECIISAKVSEEDRLYGSVAVRDIIDALAKQDIKVEKRMVLLKEAFKNTGTFKVPIRVYKDVEPEITVEIVPKA